MLPHHDWDKRRFCIAVLKDGLNDEIGIGNNLKELSLPSCLGESKPCDEKADMVDAGLSACHTFIAISYVQYTTQW